MSDGDVDAGVSGEKKMVRELDGKNSADAGREVKWP